MTGAPLPIISLDTDPSKLGSEILAACTGPGFFYLCDHGIAGDDVDAMFELSASLFRDTSEAEKRAFADRDKNLVGTREATRLAALLRWY